MQAAVLFLRANLHKLHSLQMGHVVEYSLHGAALPSLVSARRCQAVMTS